MPRRSRLAARPRLEILEGRAVLSALTPAQLDTAYGLNAVTFKNTSGGTVAGDGANQTIAIIDVDHDANLANELATFDARYGLPAPKLTQVDQSGGQANSGWATEEALDAEWAHAAAPGASLLVVEARSASTTDLLAAVNYARNYAGVSAVSMSWGTGEFSGETAYDSTFTTPVGHTGVTFLASSGDSGPGAQWPASSINVVAVGGTSLGLSPTGARASESAWSGSGGGYSAYEAEPSYQRSAQSTGARGSVDVALDADPNTGVSVYSVAGGGWLQVGGTSLSAPVWAGLIAVADEGRALAGKGALDGATQTLGDLYAAPSGSFNDITTGSRATAGYDTSTGLGSPNAATLVGALVADPAIGAATGTAATTGSGTTTTTGTGTTGSGGKTTPTQPTQPTQPTRPTRPRGPFGGWWGLYFDQTASDGPATAPTGSTRTVGQVAAPGSTPTSPPLSTIVSLGDRPTGLRGARWATERSVEVVLGHWGRPDLG